MNTNKRVNENVNRQDSNDPLSSFILGFNLTGDLTYRTLGPSAGIFLPLIKHSMPLAFLSVIVLDFFAAFAVKRSMIVDAQTPRPFEAAWRNPQQPNYFAAQPKSQQNTPAKELSVGPIFSQGISINLMLSTPLKCRYCDAGALFLLQIIQLPQCPPWVLPTVSLLIYFVSHLS